MSGKEVKEVTATGAIDPTSAATRNTTQKPLLPYDEAKEPTTSMNIGDRLAKAQTALYDEHLLMPIARNQSILNMSPNSAAVLRKKLRKKLSEHHQALQTFANNLTANQSKLHHHPDYKLAMKRDPAAAGRLMNRWSKQFLKDEQDLSALQQQQEKEIIALLKSSNLTYIDQDGNEQPISDEDMNKFINGFATRDIEYHQCQQQQLLVNLYNNRKNNLHQTYHKADAYALAIMLHNLRYPNNKELMTSTVMDFKDTFLEQHQQAIFDAINKHGEYNIKVTPSMVRAMGGSAKSNYSNIKLVCRQVNDSNQFTMSMVMDPTWSKKDRIAMLKVMVTEAKLLNLKTFDLTNCVNYGNDVVIEFIKEIRRQYGAEAKIVGESFYINNSTNSSDKQLLDPNAQNALHLRFLNAKKHFSIPKGKIGAPGEINWPDNKPDIPMPKSNTRQQSDPQLSKKGNITAHVESHHRKGHITGRIKGRNIRRSDPLASAGQQTIVASEHENSEQSENLGQPSNTGPSTSN